MDTSPARYRGLFRALRQPGIESRELAIAAHDHHGLKLIRERPARGGMNAFQLATHIARGTGTLVFFGGQKPEHQIHERRRSAGFFEWERRGRTGQLALKRGVHTIGLERRPENAEQSQDRSMFQAA